MNNLPRFLVSKADFSGVDNWVSMIIPQNGLQISSYVDAGAVYDKKQDTIYRLDIVGHIIYLYSLDAKDGSIIKNMKVGDIFPETDSINFMSLYDSRLFFAIKDKNSHLNFYIYSTTNYTLEVVSYKTSHLGDVFLGSSGPNVIYYGLRKSKHNIFIGPLRSLNAIEGVKFIHFQPVFSKHFGLGVNNVKMQYPIKESAYTLLPELKPFKLNYKIISLDRTDYSLNLEP